jgi:hypothetical protein
MSSLEVPLGASIGPLGAPYEVLQGPKWGPVGAPIQFYKEFQQTL